MTLINQEIRQLTRNRTCTKIEFHVDKFEDDGDYSFMRYLIRFCGEILKREVIFKDLKEENLER